MRRLLLGTALLLLGHPVVADPPRAPPPPSRPTVEGAADAVIAAQRADDAGALATLAAREVPDPWLVADELLRRGAAEAAAAFASAAPRLDVERLAAYVATHRDRDDDVAAREALARAEQAAARGDRGATLEALRSATQPSDTVASLRLVLTRAQALQAVSRPDLALQAYLDAAEGAERVGWLRRAGEALQGAGLAALRSGDYRAAMRHFQRGLALEERRGQRGALAVAWSGVGNAHLALGDLAQALAFHERALTAQQELGDRAAVASALGSLGNVHLTAGRYAQAATHYQRALAEMRALGDRAGAVMVLSNLGGVHHALGEWAQAEAAFTEAIRASEALGDRVGVARAQGNLGLVQEARGNLAQALETLQRSWEAKRALGDRAGAAATLGNMGVVHRSRGEHARALEILEQVLLEKQAIGDRVGAAATLTNVAAAHRSLGRYAKALELHERALADKRALGDRAGCAVSLGLLGTVHADLGDHDRALACFEQARAEKEALGDRAGALEALGNVANVLMLRGEPERALPLQQEALDRSRALGDRSGAALALANLGAAHEALGRGARALELYEAALAESQAVGDRLRTAQFRGNVAAVLSGLGEHARALEVGREALAELEELGDRAGAAGRLRGLALTQEAMGDAAGATRDARRAVALVAQLLTGLAEGQSAATREQFADVFDVGARAAAAIGSPSDLAYFLEEGRAGSLLDSFQAREALRSGLLPPALLAAEREARRRETVAVGAYRRALSAPGGEARRTLRKEMERAQEETRAAVERIQREAKLAASVVYPSAASLPEIQGALGPGEALVLYALTATQALALLVTAGAARAVPLGASAEIEGAVAALRLADPSADVGPGLARLARLVVEPLGLGADVRRLLVSPSGALGQVPFQALLPERELALVPSGTTYALLRRQAPGGGAQVLALGDPDYDVGRDVAADAVYVRGGGPRLARLPATGEEARAVGDVVLLGKEATETRLAVAVTDQAAWRAIHLACHGVVDARRPEFCYLALAADAHGDGFLTALEVFRSRLPADLVVLSACETGRGKVLRSEGIVGLTRAFMFAGAPRVICSLWKVDDAATSALMRAFYERWHPKDGTPGLPTAEALRQAQAFVRAQEKWKHPYYWAAWVLWGRAD